MTKKDYVAVARILRPYWKNRPTRATTESLMVDFARMFREDRPLFDPERFADAIRTGKGL